MLRRTRGRCVLVAVVAAGERFGEDVDAAVLAVDVDVERDLGLGVGGDLVAQVVPVVPGGDSATRRKQAGA
ncbi:hypothetical protein GCM10010498_57370 [Streptomyces cavourensis]|nr:hypothetical protein GCM10010498_57370 [Streptomyces cavourensis]